MALWDELFKDAGEKSPEAPAGGRPEKISAPAAGGPTPDSGPIEPSGTSRWRRWTTVLMFVIFMVYAFSTPVMQALGRYLVLEEPAAKADVIVLLAGSPVVRALAAADEYKNGAASRIFVSRGYLERAELIGNLDLADTGDWGLVYAILTSRGVKAEDLIKDQTFVESTLAEARRVSQVVRDNKFKSIVLVTSKFHSRRSHDTFTRVLGEGVEVVSRPSRYDPFNPDGWWRDRQSAKMVFLEYQKLIFSWFEGD